MKYLRLFSLPLLTKELIEQAHNKRTYIFRVVYAVLLYGLTLLQYSEISAGGLANLGRGKPIFLGLIVSQAIMILLMLPAITSGALTVEKEKDTLALLLLTKLSPWTIVFEKFLSRVFAIGTYLLIPLPLFGIVYGIGGVELSDLTFAIACLLSMTLICGAISILCSTWFRTTSSAFFMSYLLIFMTSNCFFGMLAGITAPFLFVGANLPITSSFVDLMLIIVGAIILAGFGAVASLFFLYIASKVLVPRAFIRPENLILKLFQRADQFFNQLNKRTTGGVVLVPDRETLPVFDSIAWRETRKKSLGTFRYQFRVLMLLLTPLIFAIASAMSEERGTYSFTPRFFRAFPAFFWVVAVICLSVHSTNAMPSERIRQTLDVILVTPLSAAEIIKQKLAGVRRLIYVLTVPIAVLVVFFAVWTGYVMDGRGSLTSGPFLFELASTSLSAFIYMPVIMWIGFVMGLKMRSQMQALLSTFAIIGACCAVPAVAHTFVHEMSLGFRQNWYGVLPGVIIPAVNAMACLSPYLFNFEPSYLGMSPTKNLPPSWSNTLWLVLISHFVFYGFIWWFLRRYALNNFSRIVHRGEARMERDNAGVSEAIE